MSAVSYDRGYFESPSRAPTAHKSFGRRFLDALTRSRREQALRELRRHYASSSDADLRRLGFGDETIVALRGRAR